MTAMKESRDCPWEMYTLKELYAQQINNFHQYNIIGKGGFGSVYFGQTSEGVPVIVFISFRSSSS